MLNPVLEIFVSKSSTAANGKPSGNLKTSTTNATIDPAVAEGDIYIVDENMAILTTVPATGTIQIAQGLGAGKVKLSSEIKVNRINRLRSELFEPSVQLVKAVGYAAVAAPTETLKTELSDMVEVTITIMPDFRIGENRLLKITHTEVCTVPLTGAVLADKTAFLQRFVDKFNNDPRINKYVVVSQTNATVTNVGLTFTALSQSSVYSVGNPSDQVVFDVVYTTYNSIVPYFAKETVVRKGKRSLGSYEELSWSEFKIQGNRGNTNMITFPIPDRVVYSKKGCNYDLYTIQGEDPTYDNHQKIQGQPVLFVIACFTANTAGPNQPSPAAIPAPQAGSISEYINNFFIALDGAPQLTNENDLLTA